MGKVGFSEPAAYLHGVLSFFAVSLGSLAFSTPPLQSQLLRSREIVRTELVAASKAKRPIALDTIHEAGESVALMAAQLPRESRARE